MRHRIFNLLRIAVTVLLLSWILFRAGASEVLNTLRQVDLWFLILSMLAFQLGVIIRGIRWWILRRGSGVEAQLGQTLGLTYSGEFFSGALPTGYAGDVLRVVESDDENSKAISAGVVLLDRMLGLSGMMLVALIALMIGYKLLPQKTFLVLLAIALLGLILIFLILHGRLVRWFCGYLPSRIPPTGEGWLGDLYQTLTGCTPSSIRIAIALSVFNTSLTALNHFLVALAVGIGLSLGLFFIFAPIVNLSLLFPTIGGLGLREAGYQALLEPMGVPAGIAVALGIGVFVSRLSGALVGGIYYLIWSLRRKGK
ncbi:MAG: hypothetical protein GTO18_22345 [Anaerolineales bacterium]|nr:hypothetical protein [Anaerolineales bacterium]